MIKIVFISEWCGMTECSDSGCIHLLHSLLYNLHLYGDNFLRQYWCCAWTIFVFHFPRTEENT